jgi:hypothetical protein
MHALALISLIAVPAALAAPASFSSPFGPLTTDSAEEFGPGHAHAGHHKHNASSGSWSSKSYTKSASGGFHSSSQAKRAIPTTIGSLSYTDSWGPGPTGLPSGFPQEDHGKFPIPWSTGAGGEWGGSMKSGDWSSYSHTASDDGSWMSHSHSHTKSASGEPFSSYMTKRAIPTAVGSLSYTESWSPEPTDIPIDIPSDISNEWYTGVTSSTASTLTMVPTPSTTCKSFPHISLHVHGET